MRLLIVIYVHATHEQGVCYQHSEFAADNWEEPLPDCYEFTLIV